MFKSYLKLAFRNILTQKVYSLINITGLALGMACTLLILMWVQDELSYDGFHANSDSLYRVEEDQYYSGGVYHVTVTPHPVAPAFKEQIPEIMDATRYSWNIGFLIRHGEKAFFESSFRAVDASFFDMFSFPLVTGSREGLFDHPNAVVLTAEMAAKYFGRENPVGQTLTANNQHDFVVTGVIEDPPKNSSLQFDFLVPYSLMREMGWFNDHWGSNSIQTFVQVQKNTPESTVNQKMTDLVRTHVEESTTDFLLAPFKDMHLHAYFGYGRSTGNIQYVYIFTAIALFVLLLACINFMNLSTARSANRAKEIGMRKVVGAARKTIAAQFLGESILMALAACLFSLVIVVILLPLFNQLSGKEIAVDLTQPGVIAGLFGVTLVTGMIAGSYPALFLSAFNPISVFRGKMSAGSKSSSLRKVLVVFQFALSILLLIGTGVVYNQLNHMMNKDLGFDKEHLLYIVMRGDIPDSYERLKQELLIRPNVLAVSASRNRPGSFGGNSSNADWTGKDPEEEVLISYEHVDYDYIETMKIEMAEGRSFSREYTADLSSDSTGNFIINQQLAGIIGSDRIIGADFSFMGKTGTIVGVIGNFHYNSLRVEIEPLAFDLNQPQRFRYINIRIQPGQTTASVDAIRDVWNQVIPDYPFDFRFVDQQLDQMYRTEQRMGDLLKYFAIFALFISILGLFGLASFMAEQRTKEIGIRKVLGASPSSIIMLLSNEFTRWVLIANLIAWPIAYAVMNNWLLKFAYRSQMGWTIFLGAGLTTLFVALATVGLQAIKSSLTNPAEALKYE